MVQNNLPFETIEFRRKKSKYFIHHVGCPRFSELDSYAVVWNGHYANYFETARLALCRYHQFDMKLLSENGCFLPVAYSEFHYRSPVFMQDNIKVAVRPMSLTESTMEFSHLLLVGNDIRAYGTVKHIAMSKETGSMFFSLPEKIKEILSPMGQFWEIT